MNKAAIYVFQDAQSMAFGFTMFSRHFATKTEADAYAASAGHKFFRVVAWD